LDLTDWVPSLSEGLGYLKLGSIANLPDLKECFDRSVASERTLPSTLLPPSSRSTFPDPKLSILAGTGSLSSLSLPACWKRSANEMKTMVVMAWRAWLAVLAGASCEICSRSICWSTSCSRWAMREEAIGSED
jgi:hypothetical protein